MQRLQTKLATEDTKMESTCHHIFGQVLKHQNIPQKLGAGAHLLCHQGALPTPCKSLERSLVAGQSTVRMILSSLEGKATKKWKKTSCNKFKWYVQLCNTKQLWWMSIVPWLCHVVDTRYTPKSRVSVHHHCRCIMCYQRCVAAITSTNGT